MKLATAPQDVTIPKSFEQRDVAIGSVAFILDMFSDKVYSHKERAVIRELSCNAHDAHVTAGTTEVPFDIHLPTVLEPWFSLRDYGTGLADYDIANVYGAIGISTKRESNELIGGFGIGSLSPYSLCDSFTVISYFNGTVSTYQCMRDSKRRPVVIPLGSSPTTEPNGLEVKLTVEDKSYTFQQEAIHVFKFWEGTIPNINNKDVERSCKEAKDEYTFKGDNYGISTAYGSMVAVMGNISYKIPSELDTFNTEGYITFEIGELEFDSARENLIMNDAVSETITTRFAEIEKTIKEVAIERINQSPSVFEKAQLAAKMNKGKTGQLIGADILNKFQLPKTKESVSYWTKEWGASRNNSTKQVFPTKDARYFIQKDRMTARIKSSLKDCERGTVYYLFESIAQSQECEIPSGMIEDLDDLPKVSRSTSTKKRTPATATQKAKEFVFTARSRYEGDRDRWAIQEVNTTEEVVYVEISRWEPLNTSLANNCIDMFDYVKGLKKLGIDVTIVGLKSAFVKTKAFDKLNTIKFEDFMKREVAKIAPKTYQVLREDSSDNASLKRVRELAKHVDSQEVKNILATVTDNSELIKMCEKLNVDCGIPSNTLQDSVDKFFNKYVMLHCVRTWNFTDHAEYIAKYIGGKLIKD